ncbi:leucine-rich repeat protein 1-like [Mytilus galloprovincialis]|uniref:leucine-rich repeat protein 1-like n=1 Tax=Mytilus galloprovincialis TaxID=29158 RepID=UPI003F7B54DD
MRLTCNVDLVNRNLPSANIKKSSKAQHTQLSIGKKPGGGSKEAPLFLMMCTAKDRNGTKFKIKDNVQQIFGKFLNEGKATIRFKEPEQDLCLSKADPLQLKNFLNLMKKAAQGQSIDHITLSVLAPASAKNVEKPKSKMIVTSRKDYPLTTNFPSSLINLQVSSCKLKRIDSRIFDLKKLQVLNLSENCVEEISTDFGKFTTLGELYLNNNLITCINPRFCLQKNLILTLSILDLSYNQLKLLPLQICELSNLYNLKLNNNLLEHLPPTIGRLRNLKQFSASQNKISLLPASFMQLKLEYVDLFGNNFPDEVEDSLLEDNVGVPSLVEACARSVKKYRVPYTDEDLHGHLCRYLDSARLCWCGAYCFESSAKYIHKVSLKDLTSTSTSIGDAGRSEVPIQGFLCSPQCLNKFKKNPRAYWK